MRVGVVLILLGELGWSWVDFPVRGGEEAPGPGCFEALAALGHLSMRGARRKPSP